MQSPTPPPPESCHCCVAFSGGAVVCNCCRRALASMATQRTFYHHVQVPFLQSCGKSGCLSGMHAGVLGTVRVTEHFTRSRACWTMYLNPSPYPALLLRSRDLVTTQQCSRLCTTVGGHTFQGARRSVEPVVLQYRTASITRRTVHVILIIGC